MLTPLRFIFLIVAGVTMLACQSNKKNVLADDVIYSMKRPVENRFVRTVLTDHLNEPMELAISISGVVYMVERTGAIKRYDPISGSAIVYDSLAVNPVEGNGLVGVTLDPQYESNHFIYFFYTPRSGPLRHQVSRFVAGPDHLDKQSEKVLIQIPIELEASAHTGGSLQFDGNGNLFISVGDNTDPSQSEGFAPIDERQGRIEFDAQRTSANTHDLRGKILRITPRPDGSYTIPDGNLFPKDGSKGKPEIYVMGCRNPYRIAVDTKTNYLYWGEIGPDSGVDGPQGTKGYDEFNQARQPGYFGWPYFQGDNKPFHDYNFQTKAAGARFDPVKPVNESVNNTGVKELLPAQKALVWYPYDKSEEFPIVGVGGRSAMAGAVYHFDDNLNSAVKFPQYFDGDVFVFDWMRNWVMAIKLDDHYNFKSLEPIMSSTKIDKPIDLVFAKDGSMYMLEYGEVYGANNPDASLVRITFNAANRAPVAIALASDSIGSEGVTLKFSGGHSYDFDSADVLHFKWSLNDQVLSTDSAATHTFNKAGRYRVTLTVEDSYRNINSTFLTIKVGNTKPVLHLSSPDNQSFYFRNKTFRYEINVSDREDKAIDLSRLKVTSKFITPSHETQGLIGHQMLSKSTTAGETLIAQSDCKACHTVDKRTVGPSFKEIAVRYKESRPIKKLTGKIINGGSGVWGPHSMSAHPQLSEEDAAAMVQYILGLTDKQVVEALPSKGEIKLTQQINRSNPGVYVLMASYTDNGGNLEPFTGTLVNTLRNARVQAEDYDDMHHMLEYPSATGVGFQMGSASNGSYLVFKNIDLKFVASLTYRISSLNRSASVELHLDSPTGEIVNTLRYEPTGDWEKWIELTTPLKMTAGIHDLFFVVSKKEKPDTDLLNIDWIRFNTNGK